MRDLLAGPSEQARPVHEEKHLSEVSALEGGVQLQTALQHFQKGTGVNGAFNAYCSCEDYCDGHNAEPTEPARSGHSKSRNQDIGHATSLFRNVSVIVRTLSEVSREVVFVLLDDTGFMIAPIFTMKILFHYQQNCKV